MEAERSVKGEPLEQSKQWFGIRSIENANIPNLQFADGMDGVGVNRKHLGRHRQSFWPE